MYELSTATSAGATQASTENSPVAWIRLYSLALAEVVACSLPPAPTLTPQPPAQVTLPVMVMSADGSMPLVS